MYNNYSLTRVFTDYDSVITEILVTNSISGGELTQTALCLTKDKEMPNVVSIIAEMGPPES